jgi:hypothetical protein
MKTRKPTIYEVLKRKLGREPSGAELKADWDRILEEALIANTNKKGPRQ